MREQCIYTTRRKKQQRLSSKTVQSLALALEGIDNVQGSHSFALGVLGVGDGITDDVLEEDLEDTAGLFINEATDALDTTTACKTANGGLGNALDVIPKDFAVTLRASLAKSLSSFTASRHFEWK